MSPNTKGKLIIVSGPSGAGKTTVLKRLFQQASVPLVASVSATTRPPRPGEINGVDYYFLTKEEFESRQVRGEFLESFQVFGRDHWYGTLRDEVATGLADGKWVVLEIDVQGALAVMQQFPGAISIFIQPGSLDELGRRLRERGTETEEAIRQRLDRANREIASSKNYDYHVINENLDEAVQEICNLLTQQSEAYHDAR